jgi:1-acyl-sn-glycerol-3-phosphate acyltransferase
MSEIDEAEIIERPPAWARAGYRVAAVLAMTFCRLFFRIEVHGQERIPTSGGFILAPVHRSNLDFMLAGLSCPRRVRWMAKHSIFLGGLVDSFLLYGGAYPVKREGTDRKAFEVTETLLERGEPVVMFPEGRRRDGREVKDLLDGPAFVASRKRVPIVPVGIGGSDQAMPIGRKVILPRKIVLIAGEPIYPDVPLEGRVPRSEVRALTARLGVELQRLYDDAQARAK